MRESVKLYGTPRQEEQCDACADEGHAFMECDSPPIKEWEGKRVVYCFACYHTHLGSPMIYREGPNFFAIGQVLAYMINRLHESGAIQEPQDTEEA